MENTYKPVYHTIPLIKRDQVAFNHLKSYVTLDESCSVITTTHNGKEYLFDYFVHYLQKNAARHKKRIYIFLIHTNDELSQLLSELSNIEAPALILINIMYTIGQDVSWFAEKLQQITREKGDEFFYYLFSNIFPVFNALITFSEAVMTNVIMLKPVSFEDTKMIIKEQTSKIGIDLTEDQKEEIFTWSKGHTGLIKMMTLLKIQYPDTSFSQDFLIGEMSIVYQLTRIMQDIPESTYKKILKGNLTLIEKNLLERLGIVVYGKLFQPLLGDLPTEKEVESMPLSVTEEKIFTFLLNNKNKIVTREQLAKIVWGEKRERKYSKWAISEIMYRIRKKLPFGTTLQTLRNRGYTLHVV